MTSGCVTVKPLIVYIKPTVCIIMYGSELWNLNCNYYVDGFRVACKKTNRRIWRLPNMAHKATVQNLSYNIDDQLETRMSKFIYRCLITTMMFADLYRCLSYFVKTQLFHQIIIISLVNMNCHIKIGI